MQLLLVLEKQTKIDTFDATFKSIRTSNVNNVTW